VSGARPARQDSQIDPPEVGQDSMETLTMFLPFASLIVTRGSASRRAPRDRRPSSRTRAVFRLEPLEGRCLLSGISSFAEFSINGPNSPESGPEQIVTGSDGNLWFTGSGGNGVGIINPTTHAVSGISLVIPGYHSGPFSYDIAAGPDGNIWFTDFNGPYSRDEISVINVKTHAVTEFAIHPTTTNSPGFLTAGPDGNVWFTDRYANAVGMINPTTDVITEFTLPTANANPRGITAGPDGNIWFTEQNADQIGEINPTTHAIAEYATPSGAISITAGPDGNIWFTEYAVDRVGEINPTTHAVTDFAAPNSLGDITSGPDGNLWATAWNGSASEIARINPSTQAITEYPIPYNHAQSEGITTGPDGNLWYTDTGTNSIGVATLASSQLVVAQQPPTSVTAGSPFGLTVDVDDSSGNLESSFNGTVTVALATNPSGATLGGTLTVTANQGVATFSGLTLTTAASGYTLQASGTGLSYAVTSAITVTPSAPAQVVVTSQPPSSVTAGSGFGLQATVEDAYGNVETSANNTVTVALANNPGGATLGGTLSMTASQGVATFSGLVLTKADSGYTFQLSSTGLGGSITSSLTVDAAAAVGLLVIQQPTSVVVNTAFTLVAEIVDAYGNVVTSANNSVSIALGNNPTGGKLGGTKTAKAKNGIVTFTGLTLSKVGTGYTILFTSNGLTGATSGPINVTSS
jgi:streptogramin lyase